MNNIFKKSLEKLTQCLTTNFSTNILNISIFNRSINDESERTDTSSTKENMGKTS